MLNTPETDKRTSARTFSSKDNLVAAGLGFVAGSMAKSVATEVFAHQELAHHTLKVKPWLNKTSRVVLAMYGLSANKFALRHRKHHRNDLESRGSVIEGILGAFEASGTNEDQLEPSDVEARHWDKDEHFDDPLAKQDGNQIVLRDNPWYERLAAKGGPGAAIVPMAGFMAVYAAAKLAGSKKPGASAASFVAASLVPMGLQPGITAYAEARAGISNGRINTSSLYQPLRYRVERHDQHHEIPWRYDLGTTPVDNLVIKVGMALGQIEEIKTN